MSPGMLYGGIDIETAKLGKSTCRNEAIAEAFHYMHIVEAWGTGIPRIINKCKIYGLPDPLFEEFGDGFKATIFRKVSNARENVSKQAEKVSKGGEKTSNTTPKISREDENISNDFEWYLPLFRKAGITDKFIANIKAVYDKCGTDVPFGQGNVQEWLECSKSKATNVMNAMKKAEIIRKVKGLGAGKYKFVEQ